MLTTFKYKERGKEKTKNGKEKRMHKLLRRTMVHSQGHWEEAFWPLQTKKYLYYYYEIFKSNYTMNK